jgi:SEC-C motif domain protein
MPAMTKSTISTSCPCGSGLSYDRCCRPCHSGIAAETAEALMCSRYTAYVLGLEDYLLATWHPVTRPTSLDLHLDTSTKWLGLAVRRSETISANEALVEFVARYKVGGKAERLHETSRFLMIDHRWYYRDGEIHS